MIPVENPPKFLMFKHRGTRAHLVESAGVRWVEIVCRNHVFNQGAVWPAWRATDSREGLTVCRQCLRLRERKERA